TQHSLYPLSLDPALTLSALPGDPHSLYPLSPGPCIHFIPVSPDPAFSIPGPRTHSYPRTRYYIRSPPDPALTALTISALPGPRTHYIRSPRTPHSLYPLSPDPALTISVLPQYTEHGNTIL
ncbi:unnamed protein product, partial [Staurois parvus]